MCNGCSTEPGFVGKCRATHTHQKRAKQTTQTGFRRERLFEYCRKRRRHIRIMNTNNDKRRQQVHTAHNRHNTFGNARNRLDAADNNNTNQNRHQDTKKPRLIGKEACLATCHTDKLLIGLIGLKDRPRAKCAQYTSNGKKSSQKRAKKRHIAVIDRITQIIHRTAGKCFPIPFLNTVTVLHAKRHFDEFGCHAEKAHQHHPNHSARTTNGNRHRNARNIPEADRP